MYHAKAESLDDLMRAVFTQLLSRSSKNFKVTSRKGNSTEVLGALLELTNPRARLGRSFGRGKVFSPLGELMWYLSASNSLDFIQYYIRPYDKFSDDQLTLNGAYGPRIFCKERGLVETLSVSDQWSRMIETLKIRNGSRNAVVQIFSNADAARDTKDVPCTCTIHLFIRKGRLFAHVHMRSNDAYLGLPHDIFSFTMLQEIAARELGVGLGSYLHSVASLHLYDDNEDIQPKTKAKEYLEEGLHEIVEMPPMPSGDPWPSIRKVLLAEKKIRLGDQDFTLDQSLDSYWSDIVRLFLAYAMERSGHSETAMKDLASTFVSDSYQLYVLDRLARRPDRSRSGDGLFGIMNDGSGS